MLKIVQIVAAFVVIGNLSAAGLSSDSFSNQVAVFEHTLDTASILDSAVKANIDHLISKTARRIKSLEARREQYAHKLSMCQDQQRSAKLLSKINALEEKLKSCHELHRGLSGMKISIVQKGEQ